MRKLLVLTAILLSATLLIGQTWEVVKQQSYTFLPSDIHFFDGENGVLVGAEGAIYATEDGGMTISPVRDPVEGGPKLIKVHFADNNNGFAVGEAGLILKTVNGGDVWTEVSDTSLTQDDLYGVAVISDQVAYVSGKKSTLMKTTDGGASWVKSAYDFQGADLDAGVAFIDANIGVAISDANAGETWYTTDGGDNWTFNSIAGLFPMGTISTRLYDIDAGGSTFAIAGYHRTLFLSTDGINWTLSGPFSYGYDRNMTVDIIDDNNIVVGGNGAWLMKTTDAGTNWDTLSYNTGNDVSLVSFPTADVGFAYGNYGQWMATTDGGSTFTPLNDWPGSSFWGLALPTDSKVYVTDWSGGDMTISENQGLTWSYPNNNATQTTVALYEIEFADENTGLIAGSSGMIKKTTDGGQSWDFKTNPMAEQSNKHINAVRYIDENTVLAGGSSAIILKSTDGGENWEQIFSEGSSTIYDFWPVSPDLVVATVGSGQILYANAALDTFYMARDYGSQSMRAVKSRNGVLLVVASTGEIFRTTDFNALDSLEVVFTDPDGNDIYDVEFITDDLVYAVGRRGRIYKSEDAGLNWVQDVSGVEESEPTLQKCRYNNNVLWAVGQNGVILKLDMTPEVPVTGILINEFLASNDAAVTDEFGEYDDYVELYNTNSEPVDIGGLYVTDKLSDPLMWQIPKTDPTKTTIPAGGYLVLWADRQMEQGVLHVDFKLSAGGEQIGLVQVLDETPVFVDSLTFEEQKTDTAYGRLPDGSDTWAFMPITPGAENEDFPPVSVVDGLPRTFAVYANYPNPFNPVTTIRFDLPENVDVTIKVYNVLGELVNTLVNNKLMPAGYHSINWNGTNHLGAGAASGIYFYQVNAGNFKSTHRMVLLK